ncbi:hypothetical protein [Achromobacter phage Motura]|uniref:Uncharacterized protein n=1 Tax=Achromobacter phage Motura TaxID=2591403 RepID=A0A514CT44_9CAUD|nr:hypothetical protein H1O15_gp168 [Achromobacter phage Motura]QDH83620.1 hypothetical protein [Achromobacter phage Motura]
MGFQIRAASRLEAFNGPSILFQQALKGDADALGRMPRLIRDLVKSEERDMLDIAEEVERWLKQGNIKMASHLLRKAERLFK